LRDFICAIICAFLFYDYRYRQEHRGWAILFGIMAIFFAVLTVGWAIMYNLR
jgi:hypothetical protein